MAPEAPSARYLLGRVLYIRGDDTGALREIDRALALMPDFPGAQRDREYILSRRSGPQASGPP
jgi:hypothetical protein